MSIFILIPLLTHFFISTLPLFNHQKLNFNQQSGRGNTRRRAAAGGPGAAGGGSSNILQFYQDDSPGLQVGPTTVLVASLSFVGIVVLLHIWGKFRM